METILHTSTLKILPYIKVITYVIINLALSLFPINYALYFRQLKKKYTFILDTQITQLIGTDNTVVETGNTKQET